MKKNMLPPRLPNQLPENFDEGLKRAQGLVQQGCDALDDGRFWSGLALGVAGILRGAGTILSHPVEAIEDACSLDAEEGADNTADELLDDSERE